MLSLADHGSQSELHVFLPHGTVVLISIDHISPCMRCLLPATMTGRRQTGKLSLKSHASGSAQDVDEPGA